MHSGTIERVPLCLDNCFYDLSYCYIGLNSSLATKYKPYLRKQLVCSGTMGLQKSNFNVGYSKKKSMYM